MDYISLCRKKIFEKILLKRERQVDEERVKNNWLGQKISIRHIMILKPKTKNKIVKQ